MIELELSQDHFVFRPKGLHQLWALRRRIDVPFTSVKAASQDPEAARGWWKGLRLAGTHLPGVITAGTYYYKGLWMFFDVRRPDRALVVELANHRYDRLIIELEDPEASLALIRQAAGLSNTP